MLIWPDGTANDNFKYEIKRTASGVITTAQNILSFGGGGGVTAETDPTVPEWAKSPTKPAYTAEEVGALPADTMIPTVPTKVSAFQNDKGYITDTELDSAVDDALTEAKESGEFDGYTPVKGVDYFTEADIADIVQRVLESLGADAYGYIDENMNFILKGVNGELPDGTYTAKYIMKDGTTVDVGVLTKDTNTYYSVTKTLTNCTINNSATEVVEGSSYSATITANSGYELKSVTATMGGSAVTVTNGKINIASVTDNIVITAVAEVVKTETNFAEYNSTNTSDWSIWINNARAGSDGTYRSDTYADGYGTPAVSNYIAVQNGDTIEFTGMYAVNKNALLCDSAKKPLSSGGAGILTNLTANLSNISLDNNNGTGTFTINNSTIAYVRIGGYVGMPNHPVSDISIKIKRNGVYL